ncbi:UNVERIFIED_CONTAM: hypothetical protein Scaly_1788400 [Sesamum calycinum]|uniref:Reverse transcriptase domain-containing protein n=1 Tax=Sesamum calycinum TaxID=2727403 RepID=A0AAW2NYL3_9LAMI
MITTVIREQLATLVPVRATTPSEAEDIPPQCLGQLESLQKGLQDIQYQVMGAPSEEQQGIPFTKGVMANELHVNCQTPAITKYDGTTDPQEHLSRFENATLLHRYTGRIKYRVFITTFARATINCPRKEGESLKEYLQRFNSASTEVPLATQEVKVDAFAQGRLDGDFFKSLSKKPVNKFNSLLARAIKGYPLIQFGHAEQCEPKMVGNDALVITALLANYEVGRIFIDSGSSADILFGEAYDEMHFWRFSREVVHSRGMISLPLILGESPPPKNLLIEILVDLEAKKDVPVQSVEELLTIELTPGEVEKVTKIGSKVKDDVQEEEIQFSKWLSNIVLVPKPKGKWMMCIDFRDLNKACRKDFYPLP